MTDKEWLDGLKTDDEVIIVQTRPGCNQKLIGHVFKVLKNHFVVSMKDIQYKVHKSDGHEVHRPSQYFGIYIEQPTDVLRKEIRVYKKTYMVHNRLLEIAKSTTKVTKEENLDKIIELIEMMEGLT